MIGTGPQLMIVTTLANVVSDTMLDTQVVFKLPQECIQLAEIKMHALQHWCGLTWDLLMYSMSSLD